MSVKVLSGKVFLIVTGSSEGIGQQIAIKFSEFLNNHSKILLLSINEERLKQTVKKCNKNVKVNYVDIDLSKAQSDQLSEIINKNVDGTEYERAVIVHNVATTGDFSKSTIEMDDFDIWRKYYDLNVFSPAVLNSVFMKIFHNQKIAKLVINLTSECAIRPFKSMGYYCSGKAAREMYFQIFAAEFPTINVLNYAPGAVDTKMLHTAQQTVADPEVKQIFTKLIANKEQLTPQQTVSRLIQILKEQNYTTGAHIDYYDDLL